MHTNHIYLFRHGQTHYNEHKMFTGWKESNLTILGHLQAKILARKLKDKQIDIAFQSTLSRSKVTLKHVLKYHPECKKIITDKRMIERSYGKLEGLPHKKIIQQYGEEQFEKFHRGYNTPPPNGESFKDVEKRVKPFIRDLKELIKKQHVNVAISAHGNSIRIFKKLWENLPESEAVKWTIPYDKYFEFSLKV